MRKIPVRLVEHDLLAPGELVFDLAHNGIKMTGLVHKIEVVGAQREHRAKVEVADPISVEAVEQGEVVAGDGRLDITPARLDALDERVNRRFQVDRAGKDWVD